MSKIIFIGLKGVYNIIFVDCLLLRVIVVNFFGLIFRFKFEVL